MVDIEDIISVAYQRGCRLKEIARKSTDNIEFYLKAAAWFHSAADILASKRSEKDLDSNIQCEVFSAYYFYEKYQCLSAYHYEKRDTEKATEHLKKSEIYLNNAVNSIINMPADVSLNIQELLNGFLPRWKYFQDSNKFHNLKNKSRAAMDAGLFADALDLYQESIESQDELIKHLDGKNLGSTHKRIAKANALGSKANAFSAMALIIVARAKGNHGSLEYAEFVEALRFEKDAYLYSREAYRCNPEWRQYHTAGQKHLENIQSSLCANLDSWQQLVLEFEDDHEFLRIMRMADLERFEEVRSFSANNLPSKQLQKVSNYIFLGGNNIVNSNDSTNIGDNMSVFDQREQKVNTQYNAAGDINFNNAQNPADFAAELEKLKAEFLKAAGVEAIDGEIVTDAEYEITKAIQQSQKAEPNKKTIVDRLTNAKQLIEGVVATAGIIEGFTKAAEVAQTIFK